MEEGRVYNLVLIDGEQVRGVYLGPERGFWLIKVGEEKIPVRPSSVTIAERLT